MKPVICLFSLALIACFALASLGLAAVTIDLVPTSSVTIPGSGGPFNFDVILDVTGSTQTFDAWIMVQLPSMNWIGPPQPGGGPFTLTRPVGSYTYSRTQYVPGTAPAGVYTYRGYVGTYSTNVKWDSSSFTFTKGVIGDGPVVGDWANNGENFEAWMTQMPTVRPEAFNLGQNYPNPFNATTAISFELRVPSYVSLRVYDSAGRFVTTLVDGWREAGTHELTFDAGDLPSGVYFCRMQAGEFTSSSKMVLLK